VREVICSRNAIYETLRAGRRQVFRLLVAEGAQEKGRLNEILAFVEGHRIPVQHVPRAHLDQINPNHQGVALEVDEYPYTGLEDILELAAQRNEPPFLLILDALQDPQNLGTLLRTAEAVGIHGIVIPLRRAAAVTPAVVHASAGASEHLLIVQTNLAQAIQALKTAGVWIIGLEGGQPAVDVGRLRLDGPLALVVGNEAEGMRRLTRQSCDALLRLPMRGSVASLNAAVAGSVVLYLAWQARGFPNVANKNPG